MPSWHWTSWSCLPISPEILQNNCRGNSQFITHFHNILSGADGFAGQAKFLNSTVDYTVGDYQLSAANYNSSGRPIVQFPIAFGSVVIYSNLTNYTAPNYLRMNGSLAAAIFQGNITTWDHPDILAINPNLT